MDVSVKNTRPEQIYYLRPLKSTYGLIKTEDINCFISLILRLVVRTLDDNDLLYSITSYEKEISLLLQQDMIPPSFKNGAVLNYKGLQINTSNPALEQVGLVCEVSKFLADLNIPVLWISSFSVNYIFYPEEYHHLISNKTDKFVFET